MLLYVEKQHGNRSIIASLSRDFRLATLILRPAELWRPTPASSSFVPLPHRYHSCANMKLRLSRKIRRKNPRDSPSTCSSPDTTCSATSSDSGSGSHSLTSALNDDLLASVLSFVSYAPYEQSLFINSLAENNEHSRLYSAYIESSNPILPQKKQHHSPVHFFSKERDKPKPRLLEQSFGMLTHVLPLVCKRCCSICASSDVLWSEAIERLATNDPRGWKLALSSYERGCENDDCDDCNASDLRPTNTIPSLVSKACLNFHASLQEASNDVAQNESTAMLLFRCLAKEATPMRFQGPVFQIRTGEPLQIGQPIGLHLFEPRYRLLIKEAMQGRSKYEKSGAPIGMEKPRPQFLFSYGVSLPLVCGDPAVIVELSRCRIYDDGRADVSIVPVMHAKFSRVWEREGSHSLMEAEATIAPPICHRPPATLGDAQLLKASAFLLRAPRLPPLGIEFRLHLFEPRYYTMMAELTQDLAFLAYRSGMVIPDGKVPRPQFIYACGRNCAPGEKALVVEVRRCYLRGNMTADVTVLPIQLGTIEHVEEFPISIQTAEITMKIHETLESI